MGLISNFSSIVDSSIWSIGLVCGYMIMNMIDVNYYSADEACKGKIGLIRILVSIIAFAMTIVYQFQGQVTNFISNII